MEIVRRVHAMKEIVRKARARGLRIGLVPTMGFLHDGHLALIRRAADVADLVIVSVFVNPTQFGPEEDYERYPRDLTRDADLCIAEGVEYMFTPEAPEMYRPGPRTYVDVSEISDRLEGASRPGHFRGVATVCLKLFEVCNPHVAVFGRKDAQQVAVVARMAEDLLLDVEILALPTVRNDDGLALSSRNAYLSEAEYDAALSIPRALDAARHVVGEGQARTEEVVAAAREVFDAEPLIEIDYVEVVDPATFLPIPAVDGDGLLVVAVRCGATRLIDNCLLGRHTD